VGRKGGREGGREGRGVVQEGCRGYVTVTHSDTFHLFIYLFLWVLQDKVMEGLERDCPGATAAAAASCERSAAGGR